MLGACLASIAAQSLEPETIEIVVVDNGSSDDTPFVARQWQTRLPNLRCVPEPVPGLSRARNRGLDAAMGEIVAFVDDDARAQPAWLARLLRVYDDDDVVAAGGRVALSWPSAPPRWMSPGIERWYSSLDLGPAQQRLAGGDIDLIGCNLSVRREPARRAGGFDLGLGRIGRRLRSGEDWRLLEELRRAGGAVVYVPDAVVAHEVLPERLRLRWLLRRVYEQGRTDALYAHAAVGGHSSLSEASAITGRALRGLAAGARRWACGARSSGELVSALTRVSEIGYARECMRLCVGARWRSLEPGRRSGVS